jgi:hypothetical protein
MSLANRLRAAWAAFWGNGQALRFAVIYDSAEGINLDYHERREEFYEIFSSPQEAYEMFRETFPKGEKATDGDEIAHNPRLVLVLGPIDDFAPPPNIDMPEDSMFGPFPHY